MYKNNITFLKTTNKENGNGIESYKSFYSCIIHEPSRESSTSLHSINKYRCGIILHALTTYMIVIEIGQL